MAVGQPAASPSDLAAAASSLGLGREANSADYPRLAAGRRGALLGSDEQQRSFSEDDK